LVWLESGDSIGVARAPVAVALDPLRMAPKLGSIGAVVTTGCGWAFANGMEAAATSRDLVRMRTMDRAVMGSGELRKMGGIAT
jgi:hypothetical protein